MTRIHRDSFLAKHGYWKNHKERDKLLQEYYTSNIEAIEKLLKMETIVQQEVYCTGSSFHFTFNKSHHKLAEQIMIMLDSFPNDSLPSSCIKSYLKQLKCKISEQRIKRLRREWTRNTKFRESVLQHYNDLITANTLQYSELTISCFPKEDNSREQNSIGNLVKLPVFFKTQCSDRLSGTISPKLYCFCNKPDNYELYVFCEGCNQWLHPKCVFPDGSLALKLTRQEWESSRCVCKGTIINDTETTPTFFHLDPAPNNTPTQSPGTLKDVKTTINSTINRETCQNILNESSSEKPNEANPQQAQLSASNISISSYDALPSSSSNESETDEPQPKTTEDPARDTRDKALSDETLQNLGRYCDNLTTMEQKRKTNIDLGGTKFTITTDEWNAMIKDRGDHRFASDYYVYIVLRRLRKIYHGCVPCIRNHYLRSKCGVMNIKAADNRYYEGYVTVYCSHYSCCKCSMQGKIKFYSLVDKIEAVLQISGERNHLSGCNQGQSGAKLEKKLKKKQSTILQR
ncbi:unnamed protein product [Clavelina lepadiformis]|uniref:Zinc finger PHD-type domain-containing protein n=1 Tax=Clavelina lepadiformis TaxID=159417 RepID=A0ABP0FTA5_CLALP